MILKLDKYKQKQLDNKGYKIYPISNCLFNFILIRNQFITFVYYKTTKRQFKTLNSAKKCNLSTIKALEKELISVYFTKEFWLKSFSQEIKIFLLK